MSLEDRLPAVAYFSMEVGLESGVPTYSGGLGILAGDTLRTAADLGVPMVGVTLLPRKGYFHQHLDAWGNQTESPVDWNPEDFMEPLSPRVSVIIEGRRVWLRAFRYVITGLNGHTVPVYFLDTDLPENSPYDRTLSDYLYGGDARYRLCQEAVLGMGGVDILRALGHTAVQSYHMNEGHSALLTMALLDDLIQYPAPHPFSPEDIEAVRRKCIFTTHTPVAAAVDQFPIPLVRQVLEERHMAHLEAAKCLVDGRLNLVYLALFFSRYINGVAMRHGEISRGLYPGYPINSITNGVHAVSWTSLPFQRLYDRYLPEWQRDNHYLRYAISIPLEEIERAHSEAKRELTNEVEKRSGIKLSQDAFTIGFARRATAYKRADLLLSDLNRLRRISGGAGRMQVVYSGKAHPRDEGGKGLIREIFRVASELKETIPVVYLEDYDMALGKLMCAGADLWLNTPQKPLEASGTSGMKAALNGVPQLSILDGWWVEGHVEGVTGWSIGDEWRLESDMARETNSLYDKLEQIVIPMFYREPRKFAEIRRFAISLNGSFYNTQRMLRQYLINAYLARG